MDGPSFIHILQSCTPGWRFEPKYAIRVLELATETGYWVNYEIENGEFRVTIPVPKRKPVKCFLQLQGRFKHLKPEEIDMFGVSPDERHIYYVPAATVDQLIAYLNQTKQILYYRRYPIHGYRGPTTTQQERQTA